MNGFWNQIILDNPLKKYLFVFIAILIGLLFKRIFSKFVAGSYSGRPPNWVKESTRMLSLNCYWIHWKYS